VLPVLIAQLYHRRGRAVTLGAGILVAAVSFSLLTAAASTSTARVRHVVGKNFRAAYDILVRPSDSSTPLERRAGLVQQNYLSGIFGGITKSQWRAVEHVPGVSVAAPIAMIGYVLPFFNVPVDTTPSLTSSKRQVFRIRAVWRAEAGLSRFAEPPSYVYVTSHRFVRGNDTDYEEVAPDLTGGKAPLCQDMTANTPANTGPFSIGARTGVFCWSRAPGSPRPSYGLARGHVGARLTWAFPFLLAAVDPVQEARLVGLDKAVTDGRYLTEFDSAHIVKTRGLGHPTVPVVASTTPFVDDTLHVSVQRLTMSAGRIAEVAQQPGFLHTFNRTPARTVSGFSLQPRDGYAQLLKRPLPVGSFWTSTPVRYRTLSNSGVAPLTTTNPADVWSSRTFGFYPAPLDNKDTAFRRLTGHAASSQIVANVVHFGYLKVVGRVDPNRIRGFNPLTRLPLSTYNSPDEKAGDSRSARLLRGRALSPDANLSGYLQPPPLLLTTIRAMSLFTNPGYFNGVSSAAPISVIRVRVGGLSGGVRQQLQHIGQVALAIRKATGLQVDVTAGASPTNIQVHLAAGKFGRRALTLDEPWVKKGVAVSILRAVDRKSATLLALILLVTAFFLINASIAAVRARRVEIGVLRCLGWPRRSVIMLVLGEVVIVGGCAGVAGAAISLVAVPALGLHLALWRILLIPPVAVLLAMTAGWMPALLAGRGDPLDAVRPAVVQGRRSTPVHSLAGLGWSNLKRMPQRTALAAAALAIGTAALTILLGIQFTFGRDIAGTSLGGFVTTQVRGVDYFSAGLSILLGAAGVADVLYLNLRERAPEFAVLAASGWRRTHLIRVGWTEGIGVGLIGSATGSLIGLIVSTALHAPVRPLLLAAALSTVGGLIVVIVVSRAVVATIDTTDLTSTLAEA
jgi:hypothetical protein